MRKIILAAWLPVFIAAPFIAAPAMAADQSKFSLGAGYGFGNGGVLSLHGDFNVSELAKDLPLKARVGYDHYSLNYGWVGSNYSWSYNVFYGGAYVDFGKALKLDNRVHPFAGLGLGVGSASCSGNWCGNVASPTVGGLYYIAGVQYDFVPNVAGEININEWGGLSIGANVKF
ncbi:MAG: hypothetical protein HY016_00305 [Nitrosomonadales bacterium]|nr:hypothetical protein [Nitrosomonadales bacterium]